MENHAKNTSETAEAIRRRKDLQTKRVAEITGLVIILAVVAAIVWAATHPDSYGEADKKAAAAMTACLDVCTTD